MTRLTDDELRAIYDEAYAEGYDPHAVPRIDRLLPMCALAPTMAVADFGCGNGVLGERIANRVARYVGVDFSPAFIRVAERRAAAAGLTNVSFHLGDITAFCAGHPGAFDAAFALDVSEHVYDDVFVALAAAIRGSLRPGAPLYLHTPNGAYALERLRAWGVMAQIEGHVAVRDPEHNERLLRLAGFGSVHTAIVPHYLPLPARLHGLGRLPGVGRWFQARLFVTARG